MPSTSDEQVASALVEIDQEPEGGRSVTEAIEEVGIAATRIRDLSTENERLRRIVADRDLEIEMLRELSRGTY